MFSLIHDAPGQDRRFPVRPPKLNMTCLAPDGRYMYDESRGTCFSLFAGSSRCSDKRREAEMSGHLAPDQRPITPWQKGRTTCFYKCVGVDDLKQHVPEPWFFMQRPRWKSYGALL